MSNPTPPPAPAGMQPLTLTVRQWRVLCRIIAGAAPESPTAWLALRPKDVVATNGHRLVSIPLPQDPARDLALCPDDILPWGKGFPARIEEEEVDEDEGTIHRRKIEHLLELRQVSATEYTLASKPREVGGALHLMARPPSWRVPDAAIAQVLAFTPEPTAHLLQTRYLRDLHRLVRAFGLKAYPGATIGRLVDGGAGEAATTFTFPTEHGDGRYVVMRMRGPEEIEQLTRGRG